MNKWAHIALWLGKETPQLMDELADGPRRALTKKERLIIGKATRGVASLPDGAPAPYGFSSSTDLDLSCIWRYWFTAAGLIWRHSPPGEWIKEALNDEVFQSLDEVPIVPCRLNDLYGIQQGRQEAFLDPEHPERGLAWRDLAPSDPAGKILVDALDAMHQLASIYSDLERGRDYYGAHLATVMCSLEKLSTQESLAKAASSKPRGWIQQLDVSLILDIFRRCAPDQVPPSSSTIYRWLAGDSPPTGFLQVRNTRGLVKVVQRWANGKATAKGKRNTERWPTLDNVEKEKDN